MINQFLHSPLRSEKHYLHTALSKNVLYNKSLGSSVLRSAGEKYNIRKCHVSIRMCHVSIRMYHECIRDHYV